MFLFSFFFKGYAYPGNGWVELVLVEARDLVAADLRGASDPYVRVHYGNLKRRTKVLSNMFLKQLHCTFGSVKKRLE